MTSWIRVESEKIPTNKNFITFHSNPNKKSFKIYTLIIPLVMYTRGSLAGKSQKKKCFGNDLWIIQSRFVLHNPFQQASAPVACFLFWHPQQENKMLIENINYNDEWSSICLACNLLIAWQVGRWTETHSARAKDEEQKLIFMY